jgi:cytochrome c6
MEANLKSVVSVGEPGGGPFLPWDTCQKKSSSGGSIVKQLSYRLGLAMLLAFGVISVCATSAIAQDAAATYKAKCAMCHGADGKGGKMGTRDFASAEVKAESDAQLIETITKGKPPKMPSYDGKLKATEIKDLVAYIRSLAK